ncbi:MAG: helix-turn-helix domain-containing protein [Oscillospiraceae bacterium]|nr:helix-turn-helix domain-containing protein [Oscillospiraceae bacterium]MBQ6719234.1 helix-turn-helix domain-containing protein [Oscillospiraceae bacterium]
MDRSILNRLQCVTAEEQAILDGRTTIDRELYMQGQGSTINARKLLASGKLITIRPHTRFIHFPEHTHDYVEVVYMCRGETTHIVNGKSIRLEQGDLLFLSQSCTHEVCKAEEKDIAVNFIVLPDFFNAPLAAMGEEETPLRRFLVDCLCGRNTGPGYLHFDVSGVKPIQNLIENLLWTLLEETHQKRKMSQMTMALLFLQITGHTETLLTDAQEDAAVFRVLRYIETNYVDCSFSEITAQLHYDPSWLSREIKRTTGKTFTQLVQEKRLAQAAFLLKNTKRNVSEISVAVGYENISYFHRIFADAFGKSPKHYRDGA